MRFAIALPLIAGAGGAKSAEAPIGWRGDGSGISPNANVPIQWNGPKKTNVLWATNVGKPSHSSPIVVGKRVFVVVPPADLVCVDAQSGKILWQRSNGFSDLEPPMAARPVKGNAGNVVPTPVSDGRDVWVVFGSGIAGCYSLNGRRQWLRYYDLPPATEFGRAASPLLCGEKLIVSMRCLTALNARNGQIIWQARNVPEMYGTPAPAKVGRMDVIVTTSGNIVRASDGAVLSEELPTTTYVTPIVVNDIAYFIDGTASAVRISAEGADGVKTKELWRQELEGEFFASPVYHEGLIYTANNEGKYYVIDAVTGKIILEKELEIPNAGAKPGEPVAHIYPSLCLVGGRIFVGNDAGDILVLATGREFKQLARNRLGEGSGATPAFSGTRMYVRGGERVYCVGAQ